MDKNVGKVRKIGIKRVIEKAKEIGKFFVGLLCLFIVLIALGIAIGGLDVLVTGTPGTETRSPDYYSGLESIRSIDSK